MVRGSDLVVTAIWEGRQAAEGILDYLEALAPAPVAPGAAKDPWAANTMDASLGATIAARRKRHGPQRSASARDRQTIMTELKNDRFLRALLREPVDRTPLWMMRQAGRYLPEYRATREQAGSFLDLCKNAELACEVTLQPLRRYPMDAAILFSDILTIPDALGLGLYFETGEGPRFRKTVRSAEDIAGSTDIKADDDLGYVMDAVRTIRRELNGSVPLIGFSGSPWTLATYMVEGGRPRTSPVKTMAYDQPELMHELLSPARRRGRRLPHGAGRGRRPGPADLRHLGRQPERRGLQGVLPQVHAAHRRAPAQGGRRPRRFR
jgi:hypothetical protein